MKDTDVCRSLCKLNDDYLKLANSKKEQSIMHKKKNRSILFKFKKAIDIFVYLGINTLVRYICNSKKMLHNANEDQYFSFEDINLNRKKIVVYTCIFGRIDNILEPQYTNSNIDYRIITDQEVPEKSVWEKVDIQDYNELNSLSNQYKNRYCKLFPDKFFFDYDYSVYVDGNIYIVSNIEPLVDLVNERFCIGMFKHPKRDDVYDEAAAVIYLNNAKPKEVKRQIEFYRKEGFPKEYGLFENSLIVRRHNSKICKSLMNNWWAQLKTFTCRDQLSFMYVLWNNGKTSNFVQILGKDIDHCPIIRRIKHVNK